MRIAPGTLLAVWIPWGVVLLALAVFAWSRPESLRAFLDGLGSPPPAAWWQQADAWLHALVALLGCLWIGVGFRLFRPQGLPWWPIALMALLALSDELAQLGSAQRSFQWSDQVADAIGLCAALPLLVLLQRLRVV